MQRNRRIGPGVGRLHSKSQASNPAQFGGLFFLAPPILSIAIDQFVTILFAESTWGVNINQQSTEG
jgi:hypothetical protein